MSQEPQSGFLTVPIVKRDAAKRQLNIFIRQFKSNTYVSKDNLDALGIEFADIDIETGIPSDGGPRLMELATPINPVDAIPVEGVDDVLHCNSLYPINDPDCSSGNLHDARFLSQFFSCNLFYSSLPSSADVILYCSPWRYFGYGGDPIIKKFHSFQRFYSPFKLHLQDHSLPDVICYLATEAPPKDDELYTTELICIMRLGLGRLRAKRFHGHHQTAAVTVISGAGRKIRIVQGYTDTDKGTILVRKSKFVEVNDEDKEKNLEKLMHIARWVLGHPCRK